MFRFIQVENTKEKRKNEREREKVERKKSRENKMTPPLLQRLCMCAFCSVQTKVETFVIHKKRKKKRRTKERRENRERERENKKKKKNRHPYRALYLINIR